MLIYICQVLYVLNVCLAFLITGFGFSIFLLEIKLWLMTIKKIQEKFPRKNKEKKKEMNECAFLDNQQS